MSSMKKWQEPQRGGGGGVNYRSVTIYNGVGQFDHVIKCPPYFSAKKQFLKKKSLIWGWKNTIFLKKGNFFGNGV